MKPPPFDHAAPRSLREALEILNERGSSARVLSGGQSLLPLLKRRRVTPEVLVDINRIEELHALRAGDDGIAIGANCRQAELERLPRLDRLNPLLAETLPLVGHLQVRSRGTVCGSLAQADPAAELPAVAVSLGARVILRCSGAWRSLPAEEFFLGRGQSALRADELLTEALFPAWDPAAGWSIEEVSRQRGNLALVGVVVVLAAGSSGYERARVTVFGTRDVPQRIAAAENILTEGPVSSSRLETVAARVRADAVFHDDSHASAEYRRHLAGVLVLRAFRRAAARTGRVREALHA